MKNNLFIICTIVNVLITLIALIFVFKVDVAWTGPLGDTFGGLLSPLIGGISIYFIYQTFKAQREQLEDQRNQHHVSRIIEVIYLQFDRINESIKYHYFLDGLEQKIQGYAGIHALNEELGQVLMYSI